MSEHAHGELKAAGLSQESIDGLAALDSKFKVGFAQVSGDKEATDKFVEEFRGESDRFMEAMSAEDKVIYDDFRKKNGLDS